VLYQKISILPPYWHRRDWNFLWDGGSLRPKNLSVSSLIGIPEGWGSLGKKYTLEVYIAKSLTPRSHCKNRTNCGKIKYLSNVYNLLIS